ncbi:hypothetical protein K466DRAFT_7131 [Polyporus arcularius HHB13444]|uniref:Exonuclease V n=1 Tax=Polyporus arcularius HHB13444 TaxID=1314778 RepID=A0A5C3PNN7_9APHY|nr:hypothetical protein K466DRAFT_7131 [Polyporus arcularius HHB13444]
MISLSPSRPMPSYVSTRLRWPRTTHAAMLGARHLQDATTDRALPKTKPKPSPYKQFRWGNRPLSVNDLATPAWCEVKFEYDLRHGRRKKLAERPESFVTTEGKTIAVVQAVAAERDRITARGQTIHEALEREIQPKAVTVTVPSKIAEERWASRLVELFGSLQTLLKQGRCRELSVFGMIQDEIVVGSIDEIVLEPLPIPKPKSRPLRPVGPAASRSGHNEPSASRTPRKSGSKTSRQAVDILTRRYSLQLSDTKTRVRHSLPPSEDMYPSRIQLMLYHRLLSSLLASANSSIRSNPLDFQLFWKRAGVDPHRKFSDTFIDQTGLLPASIDPSLSDQSVFRGSSCLEDLTTAWLHAVKALNIANIDRSLTLVYRTQSAKRRRRTGKGTRRRKTSGRENASVSSSHQEMQGLAASMQTAPCSPTPTIEDSIDKEGMTVAELAKEAKILGKKTFGMDDPFLDEYLTRVLAWWHGQRPPQGVNVKLRRRCMTCEYRDGCEWREKQAEEALRSESGSRRAQARFIKAWSKVFTTPASTDRR